MTKKISACLFILLAAFGVGCDDSEIPEAEALDNDISALINRPDEDVTPTFAPPPPPEPVVEQRPKVPGSVTARPQQLVFEPIFIEPGAIPELQSKFIEITHQSGEPVWVTKIEVSSVQTGALRVENDSCTGSVLGAPGSRCRVSVTFDGARQPLGQIRGELVLIVDAANVGDPDPRQTRIIVPIAAELKESVPLPVEPRPSPPPGPTATALLWQERADGSGGSVQGVAAERQAAADGADRFRLSDTDYRDSLGMERNDATLPVDQSRMMRIGTKIHGILEQPILSEQSGDFSAIVSHPVFASHSSGTRRVLLPRFSRIFGTYSEVEDSGQTQMAVQINLIERPDGARLDLIAAQAAGKDLMGRTGLIGTIDHRYVERFGATVLIAGLNAISALGAGLIDVDGVTESQAQLSQDLANLSNRILDETIEIRPRIYINGGARFIFTLREDLWFPEPEREIIGIQDIFIPPK